MSREDQFFIKILADHLSRKQTVSSSRLDWSIIKKLAQAHQVEGIVYFQCKEIIPAEYKKRFEQAYISTFFLYENRKNVVEEIADEFLANRIPYFFVKGSVLAEHYPIPALRTMGDIDIIIAPSRMNDAIESMLKIGFIGKKVYETHEWNCERGLFHIELHDELIHEGKSVIKQQMFFFNSFENYVSNNILDWSFHFLFLIVHLRKHFMYYGVGIRQFIDLSVIIQSDIDLNWDWIVEKLRELSLLDFASACFSLLERWFNTNIPVQHKTIDSDFLSIVTKWILDNGVFGFMNPENEYNPYATVLIMSEKPILFTRVKILFDNLFPAYHFMCEHDGFEYLDGRPYMLPIAWAHRLLNAIKIRGFHSSIRLASSGFISDRKLEKRKEFLKKMGL